MSEAGFGSVSMQSDTGGGDGGTGGGDFASMIPEGYSDKPYMQGIDSIDKMFTQFDNMQKLIGQKTIEKEVGLPTDQSTDEEWGQFYNKLGRPETADKYEFEQVELPEGLQIDEAAHKESAQKAKDLFHKAGLTAKQAAMIKKGYDEMFNAEYKKVIEAQAQNTEAYNNEFEGMLDKHFGDQKEAVAQRVNALLKEHTPKDFMEQVTGMDNKTLMLLSTVLDSVHKKYIGEDTTNHGGEPVSTETPDSLRQKARELMKTEAHNNGMHTDHDAVRKQVKELYAQAERLQVSSAKKK